MRQTTPAEMLSLAKSIEMESTALNMLKAGRMAVTDEQLKAQMESIITGAETRIRGLQQFAAENNLAMGVHNQAQAQQEV